MYMGRQSTDGLYLLQEIAEDIVLQNNIRYQANNKERVK